MSRLSHSALGRYMQCGHSYKLHYIDKIRPTVTHAALLFGSAMDSALNVLLTKPKESAEEAFEKAFISTMVNDKESYLPTDETLVYANADFDSDLLTQEDYNFVAESSKEFVTQHPNQLEVYKELEAKKKDTGLGSFTSMEKVFFNLMNWVSLRRKGFLMLKAYREKVLPKLERVISVQEHISLDNGSGDTIMGYVDLIAEVKGHGVVILDNKTSSMEYDEDAVLTSPQLGLYTHMLEDKYNTRKAGYIVMRKSVIKNRKKVCSVCGHNGTGGRHKTCDNIIAGKRCNSEWNETIDPDINIQILINEIPHQTEKLVMENADGINEAIKAGHFNRNLNSCTNWYGGKCPHFNLCYHNKMDGLANMKKENL
jgi:hypothetical protein